MRFWEAMKALGEGKIVKMEGSYPTFSDFESLSYDFVDCTHRYIEKCMTSDWEVYEEPVKTYTFQEIISFLKEGKKVNRRGWDFTIYKGMDECFHICELGSGKLSMKLEDFEATDWVVVEE